MASNFHGLHPYRLWCW